MCLLGVKGQSEWITETLLVWNYWRIASCLSTAGQTQSSLKFQNLRLIQAYKGNNWIRRYFQTFYLSALYAKVPQYVVENFRNFLQCTMIWGICQACEASLFLCSNCTKHSKIQPILINRHFKMTLNFTVTC